MAIEDWMGTLKTNMAAVSGITQVHKYDELPGTLSAFPCMIILPQSGTQTLSATGVNISLHRVRMTLFFTSQVLPEAYGQAVPFIKLVRNAIAAGIKLGGNVEHCLPVPPPDPFYDGPGEISYGDKKHIGIHFYLEIKENEAVTVSA